MAFTTMQAVLDAMPGQHLSLNKTLTTVGGGWASSWQATGWPAAAATPSSGLAGDVPTSATTGALAFNNPVSLSLYLARLSTTSSTGVTAFLTIYDRLWQNSGLSVTSTSGQTISSVALTRPDSLGANTELWWQVYAVMGSGTPNVTIAYTNSAGTASRSAVSGVLATAMIAGRTGPFQLASGDTGARSIQTWTADASFTTGTIGLVLRRRIMDIAIDAAKVVDLDALRCGLCAIPSNAALEFVMTGPTGQSATFPFELFFVEG